MPNYEGGSVEMRIKSTGDEAAQAMNRLMGAVRSVRTEIASFDKTFDNVSKGVNRLANGMKVIEKLNLSKVNTQIAGVSNSLATMGANLAKVDLSGFNIQSDQAAQSLNRFTNSFRQLDRLQNIDTRRVYMDLSRLGRISGGGIERMSVALKGIDLSKIQGAGAAINQLVNGLNKIQGLKLDTSITSNLQSQFERLTPTLTTFLNQLSGINADGLKDIAKIFRDLPKSMERMQKLDLSRLGEVFSTLSAQIIPFLAHLREASAELQALATISKSLGSAKGFNLPQINRSRTVNPFAGLKVKALDFNAGLTKIESTLRNVSARAEKTRSSFLGMFNIGKLYFLVNYTKRMGQSFANMLKSAMDFIEVENLFSRAMGTARTEALRFGNTMSEAFGLAMPELMKAQGLFNNIIKTLGGINDEIAQTLSQNLTKMAIDFSSLYNVSVESAIAKLQAALVGQTKPIRGVSGMDITQATLQNYLTQLGIVDKTVRQLSQVEKRLLIIYSLTQQMKASNAMGDFAKTIEQPANQLKILNEQMKELQRWISSLFVQSIAKALPYINAFVMTLKELTKTLAIFLGYKMPVTENIPDLLGTDEAVEGLEDATDAAEDLKNATTGIDELNIVAPKDAAGTEIDPRLLAALTEYDNLMAGVRMKANDIRDAIMGWLGYVKQINDLGEITWMFTGGPTIDWAQIQASARDIATRIAEYLNDFVAGIDWYALGTTLANGVNTALHFIYAFMTTFNWGAIGKALAGGLNGAIDTLDWSLLGKTLASKWTATIDFLYDFVTGFDWNKFGVSVGNSINAFFSEIDWAKAGQTLGFGISGVFNSIGGIIATFDWKKVGSDTATFLNSAFASIDWANVGKMLSDLIVGVLHFLYAALKDFDWYSVGKAIGDALVAIDWTEIILTVGAIVFEVLSGIFEIAVGAFESIISSADNATKTILLFFAAWKITQLMAFIQTSGGVVGALKLMATGLGAVTLAKVKDLAQTVALTLMYAKDFIVSVVQSTAALASQAIQWVATTAAKVAGTAATVAATAATWLFNAAVAVLTSPITLVIAAIAALVAVLILLTKNWGTVKETATKVWSSIVSTFSGAGAWLTSKFGDAVAGIKRVFSPLTNFFSDMWAKIVKLFSNVGTAIGDALGKAVKGVLNTVMSGIEKVLNGFIKMLNGAISIINKLPGVSISSLDKFNLPRFEGGGFPDKGMFAFNEGSSVELLGKINGRTAVANQDQIVESVSAGVYNAVVAAFAQQQDRPINVDVTSVMQVDSVEIARANNKGQPKIGQPQIGGAFAHA